MDQGFTVLPGDCISHILSLTSPPDACRLSVVSPFFRSAADSDSVWERFLPSDIGQILEAVFRPTLPDFLSQKKLFLYLSDNRLLIDNGSKSFSLEKCSGNKCYMISARELSIIWGDTPQYWKWRPDLESRFPEVAELLSVWWLEIRGKMETRLLSPNTRYGAYLVFKLTDNSRGLHVPAEVSVALASGVSGPGQEGEVKSVRLKPGADPKAREDGWMEIEMGEFFNESGEDGEVQMSLLEVNCLNWKCGLIIQGIELRPKKNQ